MAATDIQTALANEARLNAQRRLVASLEGQAASSAMLAQAVSNANSDANRQLADARTQLATLEAGGGPGVTDTFGEYSTLEQAMRAERFAGKAASIDFVKANPACSEADAEVAYRAAALAARPADRQWLLIDPASLRQEYTATLKAANMIPDTTWESWRAWIIATDKAVILGL